MKNLLALVGLVVVGFAGLGWYLGWYNVSVKKGLDGKVNISGDIDTRKITTDAKGFGDKVGKVIQSDDPAPRATTPPPANFVGPPLPAHLQDRPAGITIPIEITLPSPRR